MPRVMNATTHLSPNRCSYYGSVSSSLEPNIVNCRIDTAWPDAHFHTHCLGCGDLLDLSTLDTPVTVPATASATRPYPDPQVLLDQVRAHLLDVQSKVENVRRVTGRPQSARATLAATRSALAEVETLIASVVAA